MGHNVVMKWSPKKKETSVNIATLKAQLAKYLRLVKGGEEIVVLDHKMLVARLIPIELESRKPLDSIKPKANFSGFLKLKGPAPEKTPKIDILTLLLAERGSR